MNIDTDSISTVTESFVCSLIMYSDSNQQDRLALQLYGEFNWKNGQTGLLCSLCPGFIVSCSSNCDDPSTFTSCVGFLMPLWERDETCLKVTFFCYCMLIMKLPRATS